MKEENIVKKVCKELGITQKELAEMLEVQPSAVSNWNSGKIPKMVEILLNQMLELKECKDKLKKLQNFKELLGEI